jgi:hypothetical protein
MVRGKELPRFLPFTIPKKIKEEGLATNSLSLFFFFFFSLIKKKKEFVAPSSFIFLIKIKEKKHIFTFYHTKKDKGGRAGDKRFS